MYMCSVSLHALSLHIDIVVQHASDKSSLAVRAGAVHVISLLLEAGESHAVLRALLPSIGNLINDKVERVQLATVKLLLQVKKIRGIKYYHGVPWNTYKLDLPRKDCLHPILMGPYHLA
jgi:condensin-2 complex subunit G2